MSNRNFMHLAADEAAKNLISGDGGPFGAVIVKDGQVVGRGHNEVLKNSDPTCHAEIQAIRAACQTLGTHDLSGCILFTSCYPCPMCLSAAIWANIKEVFYGNTPADAAAIGFRDDYIYQFISGGCKDKSVMELSQLEHAVTIKSFQSFAAQTNKTLY